MSLKMRVSAAVAAAALVGFAMLPTPAAAAPKGRIFAGDSASETVYFPSADGKTELVGYVFAPSGAGPHAAVVMLHGRGGPYSANVKERCSRVARGERSPCDGQTLSKRHVMWGHLWAERGFVALHVDSFGPRGKAMGFGRHTHESADRDDVNERTVRPLDALGALTYLRTRSDVQADRIALQGWSNGASTVLNVLADSPEMRAATGPGAGFVGAVAFYPGCGAAAVPLRKYLARAPLAVFLGDADEEVSPDICAKLLAHDGGARGVIVHRFPGATHDFDDPGRQAVPANAAASAEAVNEALRFIGALMAR